MSTSEEKQATKLDRLEEKLNSELNKLKHEVDDLYETVYKGNGSPSLVTRVNSVEGKLRGLREQMDEKISHLSKEHALKFDSIHQKLESKFGRLEGWIETKFSSMENTVRSIGEHSKIDRTGGWQIKIAMIGFMSALIGAIIVYLSK